MKVLIWGVGFGDLKLARKLNNGQYGKNPLRN